MTTETANAIINALDDVRNHVNENDARLILVAMVSRFCNAGDDETANALRTEVELMASTRNA